MDNKPPPRAWQWSTFSHSVCFLDLTTLLLIRFRHLCQFPFSFNQTMVQDRVQPLYSMASSLAHDSLLQEANTISYVHLLMSRAWRHLDVTHVPLVIQVRDLFFIKSQKMIFFTLKQCVFLDFRGCEGSGACFERLRMRSRSRRKCAHRNAGDLESSLEVCACVYDPIHVTAQGKSLGPNCACVQPPRHYRGLPMNACVLYPMGSREFYDHIWALKRHWVTWPICSILIGWKIHCCALIGYRLK